MRGVERIGGFGGKSDILATSFTYSGTPDAYKQRLQRIEHATGSDLCEAARAWLSDGVYALEVTPFSAKPASIPVEQRLTIPELGRAARTEAARYS